MIQQIAYNLYLNDIKKRYNSTDIDHEVELDKYDFLFTSELYVNYYFYKAKQEYRKIKLKNIINE
jgi:hypothetical protein